ncbi:hypothetical protein vseg_020209 [Gypsophila vaccaria]
MISMASDKPIIMFVILLVTCWLQGSVAMSSSQQKAIENRLRSINKPAVKSFKSSHGDILDCVKIHKQLAFDHPLLRNHSIQMRPTTNISRPIKSSKVLKTQQILPRNIRCPKGTVLVKRVQKEDIISDVKFSKFLATQNMITNSQKTVDDTPQPAQGHQVASLTIRKKSIGVHGNLNIWEPEVAENQFSSAFIFASSDDGSVQNFVEVGWSVNSALYDNNTRLQVFWTRDSARTSGCFNTLCSGFVQISQGFTPGLVLKPLSTFGGPQYEINLSIKQDTGTGHWWIYFGEETVGYYPKELFTSLTLGADGVGWGGEVASPSTEPAPAMGSGHFPEEGPGKACYISQMQIYDTSGQVSPPDHKRFIDYVTKPDCYKAVFQSDRGGQIGSYMLFGGPPGCKN